MDDLDIACYLLDKKALNLVVVKEGRVLITSKQRGIGIFFEAVVNIGDSLIGAAVADKIMGSAMAMLCLYARVASVFASIASKRALEMLRKGGVGVTAGRVVPYILNPDHTDLCPFEKLAQGVDSPSQLFSILCRGGASISNI